MKNGFTEIPEKYIHKRWTKDAKVIIPDHLEGLVKDTEEMESRAHLNAVMHEHTLTVMRIGNTSAEMRQMAIEGLLKLIDSLKLSCTPPDSSKNSRRSERVSRVKPKTLDMVVSDEDDDQSKEDGDDAEFIDVNEDEDMCEDDSILETEIQPPEVKRGRGRPKVARNVSNCERATIEKKRKEATVSREKNKAAPAGGSSVSNKKMQIRYCKTCGNTGHNSTACGRESSYKRKE